MSRIEWKPQAVADLLAIVEYVSNEDPAAVQALKDEIAERVSRLPDNPRLYRRGRVVGTREMVVRSNYIVVYRDDGQTITVLRVLHAARQWPET